MPSPYILEITTQGNINIPQAATEAPAISFGTLHASDVRYNRPNLNTGACIAGDGAVDHPVDAITLKNTGTQDKFVDISINWEEGDGFIFLYRGVFDANNPLTNCNTGNDDDGSTRKSKLSNIKIAPSEVITVVLSAFTGNSFIGPYDITVATR